MPRRDQCGSDYDMSFEVTMAGESYAFDSLECAIHKLAPIRPHCGCDVVGAIYCCAHCTAQEGPAELTDRAR